MQNAHRYTTEIDHYSFMVRREDWEREERRKGAEGRRHGGAVGTRCGGEDVWCREGLDVE